MTAFTRKWLLLAIVGIVLNPICLLCGSFLDLSDEMLPDEPFDVKPAVSLEDARTRFEAISPKAEELYKSHLVWDVPYFLTMGLASASLLMLAWGPGRAMRTYALVLMFTAAFVVFDAAENLTIWRWFQTDGPTAASVAFASFVTKAKFASLGLTIPVLLMGVWQRFKNRSTTEPTAVRA